MVVAVHGTESARGVGFRLPRMLRAVLLATGLSALAWLLLALFGAGTASAEPPPPNSGGLAGGVVNGLTSTVGGVVSASSTTVATVADTGTAAVIATPGTVAAETVARVPTPKAATPPAAPVAKSAAPKPVAAKPVVVKRTPRAVAPTRQHAAMHKAAAVAVKPVSKVPPENQVNRPGLPEKAPVKAPLAPAGSVSAGHDGPGTARGLHGTLPIATIAQRPAVASAASGNAGVGGGRTAGLPATSPD